MKYIKYILIFFLLIPLNIKADDIELNSKYAILYDLDTNEILLEKNSEEKIAIASLTKIMTTIVAIENIDDIKEEVTIPAYALEDLIKLQASTAGFQVNQKVTYEDLLYGIMLPSGADAAKTVAYYISNGEEEYVKLMNNKAKELGLKNTKYYDTTGLNDNNYSTVTDVAELLKYALKNDTFYKIFTTQSYITTNNMELNSTLKYYTQNYPYQNDYIYGAKTGFTDVAGYCLASIAKDEDNNHFLLVTAKAPSETKYPYHFEDAINTYKYYTNEYHKLDIYNKNDVILSLDTKYSTKDKFEIKANNNLAKYVKNDINEDDIKLSYDGLNVVTPFAQKGKIGTLNILLNNEIIQSIDINYDGNLPISIPKLIKDYIFFIIPLILIIFFIIKISKKKKRKSHK